MKFGAPSEELNAAQLRLPKDDPGTDSLLARLPSNTGEPVLVYFGCPVWGNKDWVGKIYPHGTKSADFLEAYAKQFNAIELNATYYKLPEPTTLLKWKSVVDESFRFCPKFPRQISHGHQLENCRGLTLEFINRMHGLGENLGDFFLQLPPAFGPSRFDTLRRFLDDMPGRLPLHFEFRHPGWFSDGKIFDQLCAELEDRGAGMIITDTAGRRDAVHMRLTCSMPMIRFTGNDLHATDETRLEDWAARINTWITAGLKTFWFFFHEPNELYAPDAADIFLQKLTTATGLELARINFVKEEEITSAGGATLSLPSSENAQVDSLGTSESGETEGSQMELF